MRSKIDRRQPIPLECADLLETTVGSFPTPVWVIDGRRNRPLQRIQTTFREIIQRVRTGEEVRWSELCSLRSDFMDRRDTFYSTDKRTLIDEAITSCLESIQKLLDGEEISIERKTVIVGDETLIFASPALSETVAMAQRLADEDVSILILGETGAGKDLIAKLLHEASSKRKGKPLKAINCAAISPQLLESELFGHVRGAFTGAHRDRKGLLEEVGEGTLFLDEIGEMEPQLQAKLLRALQERTFRKVGDSGQELPFRGRVVSATNRDLEAAIRDKEFRMDLFFRIAGFQLQVPPLHQRPEDISVLIDFFLERINPRAVITDAARAKLMKHHFPGNVRELESVIRKAQILASLHKQDGNIILDEEDIQFFRLNGTSKAETIEQDPRIAALEERIASLERTVKKLETT